MSPIFLTYISDRNDILADTLAIFVKRKYLIHKRLIYNTNIGPRMGYHLLRNNIIS